VVDTFSEHNPFTQDEILHLHRRTRRNRDLSRLEANPSTFSTGTIVGLMLKFNNCRDGRFRLARALAGADKAAFYQSNGSTGQDDSTVRRAATANHQWRKRYCAKTDSFLIVRYEEQVVSAAVRSTHLGKRKVGGEFAEEHNK